jgi:hypothetical protein
MTFGKLVWCPGNRLGHFSSDSPINYQLTKLANYPNALIGTWLQPAARQQRASSGPR